jgi:hypothetical protein
MLISRLAALSVVALTATGTARAQSAQEFPEEAAPGWVMTPSIGIGVAFDDNPVLTGVGNPMPNDTITSVAPALQLAFTGRHTFLGVGYNGSMVRYRTLDEYDSYDQGAHAELRQQVSRRVGLTIRNNYSAFPTTDPLQVAGVPFFRTGTRQNTFRGETTIQATRGLALTANYRFQWLEFDQPFEPVSILLDGGKAHAIGVGASQAVSSRVGVGGGYSYLRALVGEAGEVFNIQNGEASMTVQLSPTVTLDGGAGFSHVALPDGLGTRTGPSGRIALAKRTEHAMFAISAMRSFIPAFGFGGTISNSEVTATVRVPFRGTRGFVATSAALRDSEPILETDLGVTALWLETTLGYAVQRWLRVEMFYNGAFQDTSAIAGGRIDRNRFGVRVVTRRPMRIQ